MFVGRLTLACYILQLQEVGDFDAQTIYQHKCLIGKLNFNLPLNPPFRQTVVTG